MTGTPVGTTNMKTGRKPREGILCRLPCLMWRVREMSEAQSKGTSSLASTGAVNVGGCHSWQWAVSHVMPVTVV